MRLATFNVENMFERVKAMNMATWAEGRDVLEDFQRLSELIQLDVYTDTMKSELLTIMKRHRGLTTQGESKYLRLRDIRGKLLRKPANKPVEIAVSSHAAIGVHWETCGVWPLLCAQPDVAFICLLRRVAARQKGGPQ
jgi:hypothetical protein